MWAGSAGSTATRGSTSAFSYRVPDCGTPSQPGGNGLGLEATDGAVGVNAPELAAPTKTTAAASTAMATTIFFMSSPPCLCFEDRCLFDDIIGQTPRRCCDPVLPIVLEAALDGLQKPVCAVRIPVDGFPFRPFGIPQPRAGSRLDSRRGGSVRDARRYGRGRAPRGDAA